MCRDKSPGTRGDICHTLGDRVAKVAERRRVFTVSIRDESRFSSTFKAASIRMAGLNRQSCRTFGQTKCSAMSNNKPHRTCCKSRGPPGAVSCGCSTCPTVTQSTGHTDTTRPFVSRTSAKIYRRNTPASSARDLFNIGPPAKTQTDQIGNRPGLLSLHIRIRHSVPVASS